MAKLIIDGGILLMRIVGLVTIGLCLAVCACVSGAPTLTPEQEKEVEKMAVYKPGEVPSEKYQAIGPVTAADCSGAPLGGRVWGDSEKAVDTLKRKAVVMSADAVLNVSCSTAPLLNNCWAARKCSGDAVKIVHADLK